VQDALKHSWKSEKESIQ